MEFVSIASSADRLVRAGQRILLETTASGTTNDDDFAHLSGSTNAGKTMRGNDGRDWTASSPGTQSLSPQQFTSTVSSSGLPSMVNDGERPLLSPSAEAELFLLATNFLLYVAMVIITTMIAKIYFPESLERGQNLQQGSNVTHISRSVSYRIVDRSTEEDDEGDEETENLLGLEEDDTEDCEQESSAATKRKRSKVGIDGDNQSRPPAEKNRSGRFLIDEPASELSPKPLVMRRLIFCCIMLNVTFVTWGLLQVGLCGFF